MNKIHILYFASLGEQLCCKEETIDLTPTISTVSKLKQYLSTRGEPWSSRLNEKKKLRGNKPDSIRRRSDNL